MNPMDKVCTLRNRIIIFHSGVLLHLVVLSFKKEFETHTEHLTFPIIANGAPDEKKASLAGFVILAGNVSCTIGAKPIEGS